MEQKNQMTLSPRQIAALPYIIAAPTLSEGARLAEIGRTTLYRWMDEPDFRQELERLRSNAAELAHVELNGLMLKSVLVLAENMENPDPGVRLRAARASLYVAMRANELKEFQRRLDRLDGAFALWSRRNPR